jgi:aspartate 4-decarboxylase
MQKLKTTRSRQKELEQLSPFELKDSFIKLDSQQQEGSVRTMLNAGRGNPNWTAIPPREAFFLLGKFGVGECKAKMSLPSGIAGSPQKKGIAARFESFIQDHSSLEGAKLLKELYEYGVREHQFVPEDWVFELAEGIVGNQYPTPDRMLRHTEVIVHDYLVQEMCGNKPPQGKYDIFAVEGGTAAMCYLFDSLVVNGLLKKGDKIALGVPAFTPYLEIPELDRYQFDVVHIQGSGRDSNGFLNFQYPDSELNKLGDKSIKAFFITNPSNPTSVRISDKSLGYLEQLVRNLNPNLMVLTDDVYGTFVDGFRSLMSDLPHNTLCVYSFSKYFGATGWRLGVIALHEDNVYDRMIAALPPDEQERLAKLYSTISLQPGSIKFIDRLVADSRQVALNHTAGLSLPQQMQMLLFAGFAVLDKANDYKKDSMTIVQNRYKLLWEGMSLPIRPDPDRAAYYCELNILEWATRKIGQDFVDYLHDNYEPVDVLFRLAEMSSIVLLNGGGFGADEWSVRVSLANLEDKDYSIIGQELSRTMLEYVTAWEDTRKKEE